MRSTTFSCTTCCVWDLRPIKFTGWQSWRLPEHMTILKWLKKFYWRFFSQQFKRSCLPDGPKVGSVTLSPRGDWRMPSDACVTLWQKDLENLSAE